MFVFDCNDILFDQTESDSFYNQALIDLEKVSVPKDKKNELLVFINKLMEREL